MVRNLPLNHARAFVMAWKHRVGSHWQLPDLHPDVEVTSLIEGTDWCDEPPIVEPA